MEYALIAKFSNGRPHVSMVEREFRNSWKLDRKMTVSDLDGRHILIILESEKDVTSALTQAPRRVGTSLFRLFKWTPEFHLRKESPVITIWIRFPRLRPDLFNEGILRCLCQPFGRFLDADSHTKQRTRCAFARCCVEIDIAKALPHEIWIDTGDGNGWWQEIVYEGNLKYCSKCRLHGHNLSECRKMRMRSQDRKEEGAAPAEKNVRLKANDPRMAEHTKQSTGQEWIQVQGKKNSYGSVSQQKGNNKVEERKEGTGTILCPGQVEEGEIEVISDSDSEPEQELKRSLLKKSNSETNLEAQGRKEGIKSMEFMTRSQSMSNIQGNCKESKLEYLREEFNHLHLISKHLKRTKEETQLRLKLLEERKKQEYNYLEDIQQDIDEQSQEDLRSIIPETQLCSRQQGKEGEASRKKKKTSQSGNKPVTRAAKKQLSPKKK